MFSVNEIVPAEKIKVRLWLNADGRIMSRVHLGNDYIIWGKIQEDTWEQNFVRSGLRNDEWISVIFFCRKQNHFAWKVWNSDSYSCEWFKQSFLDNATFTFSFHLQMYPLFVSFLLKFHTLSQCWVFILDIYFLSNKQYDTLWLSSLLNSFIMPLHLFDEVH